jgi:sporulation protein YlmC with PRC-barrel domain
VTVSLVIYYGSVIFLLSFRHPGGLALAAFHRMHKFRRTLGATTLIHDKVVNLSGQDIGRIEELMIDVTTGRVAYAVLTFGGFMGFGNKLFALPWSAITVDEVKKRFVVNVTRESLEKMPGFDKEHWPDLNDLEYATGVYRQWGATPYWT